MSVLECGYNFVYYTVQGGEDIIPTRRREGGLLTVEIFSFGRGCKSFVARIGCFHLDTSY